jgi:hypothetical protein
MRGNRRGAAAVQLLKGSHGEIVLGHDLETHDRLPLPLCSASTEEANM